MEDKVKQPGKRARAQMIMDTLQALYPEPPVPLDHSDPFTLLVAVLLSAQCTDERVNQVTPELFAAASDPAAMAALDVAGQPPKPRESHDFLSELPNETSKIIRSCVFCSDSKKRGQPQPQPQSARRARRSHSTRDGGHRG